MSEVLFEPLSKRGNMSLAYEEHYYGITVYFLKKSFLSVSMLLFGSTQLSDKVMMNGDWLESKLNTCCSSWDDGGTGYGFVEPCTIISRLPTLTHGEVLSLSMELRMGRDVFG